MTKCLSDPLYVVYADEGLGEGYKPEGVFDTRLEAMRYVSEGKLSARRPYRAKFKILRQRYDAVTRRFVAATRRASFGGWHER